MQHCINANFDPVLSPQFDIFLLIHEKWGRIQKGLVIKISEPPSPFPSYTGFQANGYIFHSLLFNFICSKVKGGHPVFVKGPSALSSCMCSCGLHITYNITEDYFWANQIYGKLVYTKYTSWRTFFTRNSIILLDSDRKQNAHNRTWSNQNTWRKRVGFPNDRLV